MKPFCYQHVENTSKRILLEAHYCIYLHQNHMDLAHYYIMLEFECYFKYQAYNVITECLLYYRILTVIVEKCGLEAESRLFFVHLAV